jgi:hypothetical protein
MSPRQHDRASRTTTAVQHWLGARC